MADSTDQDATPADAEAPAARQPKAPPLVVNAQYIKDLSLEVPNCPEVFAKLRQTPQVTVDVDVHTRRLADSSYEVTLHLRSQGRVEDETVFIVELTYGGVFTLNNVLDEHVRPVLLIECPRLMFPFARGVIATVTREGGIPPLLINPIDFADLYRRQLEREQGAGQAPGPAGVDAAEDEATETAPPPDHGAEDGDPGDGDPAAA